MANCPKSHAEELIATTVSPGLHVLGCASCTGALISLVSYRAWREAQNFKTSPATDKDAINLFSDDKTVCLCPKCRGLMSKYLFTASYDKQLDYCPRSRSLVR